MTRTQIIHYFNGQITVLSKELAAALMTADNDKIQAVITSQKPQLGYLRGYATCMEHAGFIDKSIADQVFAMFDNYKPTN